MSLLGDIRDDVRGIRRLLEAAMAKKKRRKLTPEDEARFEENTRKLRERIAEREAREREYERRRAAG